MALTLKRRLTMRAIGIACGLVAFGVWQLYKQHGRDTSPCAQVFSREQIERWGGEPIDHVSGFAKDHLCGYMATARNHGFQMHRDLIGVKLEPVQYESMVRIHVAGKRSSTVDGLDAAAVRFTDLFGLDSILVDLGRGTLVVSAPARTLDSHGDEILGVVKAHLDLLRAETRAHEAAVLDEIRRVASRGR